MTDNDRQPDDEGRDTTDSTTEQTTSERTEGRTSGRERTRTRSRGRRASSRSRGGEDAVNADDAGNAEHATSAEDRSGAKADASEPSGGVQDAASGDDPDDDGRSKRRRRRGRRGRGRGRGKGGDTGTDVSTDDRSSTEEQADGASTVRGERSSGRTADPDGDGTPAGDPAPDTAGGDPAATDGPGSGDEQPSGGEDSGEERTDGSATGTKKKSTKKRSSKKKTGTKKGAAKKAAAKEGSDSDPSGDDGPDGAGDPDDAEVEKAIARGGTRMAAKRSGRRGSGGSGGGNRRQQRPGGVSEEVRRAILEGPPRTMLVTSREDRTQIAVMEDRTVVEHYVTRKEDVTFVGNIYMARVQNVLPGMEAAFLDIGKGRNGVLYAGEVLYDELDLEEGEDERIENVLKQGQKVLVQVTKDPMGSKGPRLTMHLSLAGRYMVLAPNSDLFGISRKLTDKERDRLRKVVKKVKPDHHGVIVRTAAEGATEEQITADLERLLAKWDKVEQAADGAKALTAVYEEPKLVVKVIRDNFGPEFERCIVDDEELYHQVRGYLEEVAPELLDKVELYGAPTADARARAAGAPSIEEADRDGTTDDAGTADDERPVTVDIAAANERRADLPALFDAYDVTDQLRKAMSKKVWLPSGGYLIVETTEAMKVIDVNTGKFTGGSDTNLEEVVLKTNLEAADEIVRQLRLRDMGGIIIIDFIDMLLKSNQEQVVRRLKRELLRDRTKTRVSEVSRLGLVQMTRKNVSQGLVESFSHTCDACEGRGLIPEID